jgi:deoxycytidylate deaminase
MEDVDSPPKTDKHTKFFKLLEKIATAVEPVASARLAAAVVLRGEVISVGINQRKSHPFQSRFGKNEDAIYLHAETDAIKNALKNISQEDLAKASLYVMRVKYADENKKKTMWGLSKPCSGCARAIATFGIQNVYYSKDDCGYAHL